MKLIRFYFALCLLLVWASNSAALEESIALTVSPQNGTVKDTFSFIVIVSGVSTNLVPHLEGGDDFVLRYGGAIKKEINDNGRTSITTEYQYELTPKKAGKLKTPKAEVSINGRTYEAHPLTIDIQKAPAPLPSEKQKRTEEIYLLRNIFPDTVYEGEQLESSLKLYSQHQIEKGSFDNLQYNGFWKETLGTRTAATERINGKRYTIHRVGHALFPLRSGKISLPPAVLNLIVNRPTKQGRFPLGRFRFLDPNFFQFSTKEQVQVRSESNTITVRPLPEPPAPIKPLAHSSTIVGNVSLSLGYDTSPIAVGEGKTITVTVVSTGNIRPLDKLNLALPPNVRQYQDKVEENVKAHQHLFRLEKTFRISLVAEHPGTIAIPPISLRRFDPSKKTYEIVSTRPIRYVVTGDAPQSSSSTAGVPSETATHDAVEIEDQAQEGGRTLYRFREESLLEWLSRSISLSLALLVLAAVALLLGSCGLALYLLQTKKESKNTPPPSFLEVKSVVELYELFLHALSRALGEETLVLRGRALEERLQEQLSDEILLPQTTRFIDKLSSHSFSGQAVSDEQLKKLVEEASELGQRIWEQLSA